MAGHFRAYSFSTFGERADHPGLREWWLEDGRLHGSNGGVSDGSCLLCGTATRFILDAAGAGDPNERENLRCATCGLNARVRAALSCLRVMRRPAPEDDVYLTEQATRTYAWAQRHLRCRVRGSEFEPDARKRSEMGRYLACIGGSGEINFNDVTSLSFEDESLDAIVSLDVLEHVPDYKKALKEFRRTLRPGGVLIATFPFIDVPETLVRAKLAPDGSIAHLTEPEYHGDPLGGQVLCWYHFGWDVLDTCRSSGFDAARFVMPYGREAGFCYGLWTLVAQRVGDVGLGLKCR